MSTSSNTAQSQMLGAPASGSPFGSVEQRNHAGLYEKAQEHFVLREYTRAITALETLLAPGAGNREGGYLHSTTAASLLLARAYYHSAQLGRAESTARQVLAEDPTDSYAALLLGRSLQRQGRNDEADPILRLAKALGAPGLDD